MPPKKISLSQKFALQQIVGPWPDVNAVNRIQVRPSTERLIEIDEDHLSAAGLPVFYILFDFRVEPVHSGLVFAAVGVDWRHGAHDDKLEPVALPRGGGHCFRRQG